MKIKSLIPLILISILAIAIFSGCGGSSESTQPVASDPSATDGLSEDEIAQQMSEEGTAETDSDSNDSEGVKAAYVEYQRASYDDDFEAICEMQTDASQQSQIRAAKNMQQGAAEGMNNLSPEYASMPVDSCPTAIEIQSSLLTQALSMSEIESDVNQAEVKIDGSFAHISRSDVDTYWYSYLRYVDGEWMIEDQEQVPCCL